MGVPRTPTLGLDIHLWKLQSPAYRLRCFGADNSPRLNGRRIPLRCAFVGSNERTLNYPQDSAAARTRQSITETFRQDRRSIHQYLGSRAFCTGVAVVRYSELGSAKLRWGGTDFLLNYTELQPGSHDRRLRFYRRK